METKIDHALEISRMTLVKSSTIARWWCTKRKKNKFKSDVNPFKKQETWLTVACHPQKQWSLEKLTVNHVNLSFHDVQVQDSCREKGKKWTFFSRWQASRMRIIGVDEWKSEWMDWNMCYPPHCHLGLEWWKSKILVIKWQEGNEFHRRFCWHIATMMLHSQACNVEKWWTNFKGFFFALTLFLCEITSVCDLVFSFLAFSAWTRSASPWWN